jgi:hypothetical protein
VYYELVALAEPMMVRGRRMLGVWSGGVFFPLGEMPTGEGCCDSGECETLSRDSIGNIQST